jgi:ubiquinone/menaquinone biosynthesis C-methylase UbiE
MGSPEFTRASRAVWEAMARGWDERNAYREERARPVAERMLERAALRPGEMVLDLAAGTGVVGLAAARAVAPQGRVIIGDFSPAMIAAAGRHASALGLDNVDFRILDAERMDLQTDAVDAVLCRWGYMLMADPQAAVSETRRVLRPGGRLSCAVFAGPQQNPWAALPSGVLHQRGHMPAPRSDAPGILALGDRARLEALFAQAGFTGLEVEEVAFTWTFEDADEYWGFLTDAAGALAMVIARLDDEERAAVRAQIADALGPFRDAGTITMPAVSLVATAS